MSFRIELSDDQIITQHQDHIQNDARNQNVEVELQDTHQASDPLTILMHIEVRDENSIIDIESSLISNPPSHC